MKTGTLTSVLSCPKQGWRAGWAVLALVAGITGCQKEVSKEESIAFWPLFPSEKTFVTDQDGTKHFTDTGSACLIAHWDKSAKVDNMGKMVYQKKDVSIWPIFDSYETKEPHSTHKKGTILLLFHFDTAITAAASPQTRP